MKNGFKIWLGEKLLPLVVWLLKEDAYPLENVLKGKVGEALVQFCIWLGLDKKAYPRFHNIFVPVENGQGRPTQIDTVVVSRYGVFVVEVKNMKGWIFIAEGDEDWAQNGKQHRDFNPVRQNRWHIEWLSELLELPETAFESVVFFVPNRCEFKGAKPPRGVMNRGLISYIRGFWDDSRLSDEQVRDICAKLEKQKEENARERAARLRTAMESPAPESAGEASAPLCRWCNAPMDMNIKTNPEDGKQFLGCSAYSITGCRYTKSA